MDCLCQLAFCQQADQILKLVVKYFHFIKLNILILTIQKRLGAGEIKL